MSGWIDFIIIFFVPQTFRYNENLIYYSEISTYNFSEGFLLC